MRTNALNTHAETERENLTPRMGAHGSLPMTLPHVSRDPLSIRTSETNPSDQGPLAEEITVLPTPAISVTPAPIRAVAVPTGHLDPKEYREEYADMMLEHFMNHEKFYVAYDTHYFKDGSSVEKERQVPNPPPSYLGFAQKMGVTTRRLKMWAKENPRFREAMEECDEIIKQFIIENGITAKYSSQFAIFVAKNVTDMKDKTEHTKRVVDVNRLLNQIEAAPTPAALRAADTSDIYETEL